MRIHIVCWGGGGSEHFKKMLIMKMLHFHMWLLKINIFKVLFWGREGYKKSTLCTLLIMLTILDDPLLKCLKVFVEDHESSNVLTSFSWLRLLMMSVTLPVFMVPPDSHTAGTPENIEHMAGYTLVKMQHTAGYILVIIQHIIGYIPVNLLQTADYIHVNIMTHCLSYICKQKIHCCLSTCKHTTHC